MIHSKPLSWLIAVILLLAACTPSLAPVTATPAPTPTAKPSKTPVPPSTPTEVATATDAATATVDTAAATATAETENYEKIEANVKGFLEKSGEYTDEELEKRLFDLDHPHNGHLGGIFYSSSKHFVLAQEVLLGGEVKGDFVYFILGTLDKQMNRFVHIGVFPVKYFQTGAVFPVSQINSKTFHGTFENIKQISSINEMQDLLIIQQGKGILLEWWYPEPETGASKYHGTEQSMML